jgi:hypothetical protein
VRGVAGEDRIRVDEVARLGDRTEQKEGIAMLVVAAAGRAHQQVVHTVAVHVPNARERVGGLLDGRLAHPAVAHV